MTNKPPYIGQLFLKWFCTTELVEEIEGDLYEEFIDNSERYGIAKAQRLYSWTASMSFMLQVMSIICNIGERETCIKL